jgi:5-methylcytosine-specific restriction endonuclease McrA
MSSNIRRCNKCNEIKQISDFQKKDWRCNPCRNAINRARYKSDGSLREAKLKAGRNLYKRKKEQIKEQHRQYYDKNRSKVLARHKQYRESNPDLFMQRYIRDKAKFVLRGKLYYEKNKDRIKERSRTYRTKNIEAVRQTETAYNNSNRDARREFWRRYARNNPEKRRVIHAARSARKRANGGYIGPANIIQMNKHQRGRCFYCGDSFGDKPGNRHVEHKTPVCRGGSSDPSNIVLACKSCNLRKHTKTAEEFLRVMSI